MQDWYEKPHTGARGAYCSGCNSVKLETYFKRKLTRAQAAARGYAGNVQVEIESKFCTSCQPKRKPTRKLTKKELMNRVANGDTSALTAKLELKRRHTEARATSRRAVSARWDKVRAKPWMDLVKDINEEINAVKHQRYYAQRNNLEDLHRFAESYEGVLLKQRALFRICARTQNKKGDAPPESWWWPDFIERETVETIRETWEQIPADRRLLTRVPLIFRNTERPDTNPHEQEDRLTQAIAQIKSHEY